MSQYYYLISGLYDLLIDNVKQEIDLNSFMKLCSEEMSAPDYDNLKKIFIFNDLRNCIEFNKSKKYLTPSYYNEEEFNENQKDFDSFISPMAEFLHSQKAETRLYPDLTKIDELTLLFYNDIDNFAQGFVKDYFLFELDLQNVTTALSQKKHNKDYSNKIIPYGYKSLNIIKNTSHDFGLSKEIPYIETLIEVYESNDLIKIEKIIEDIRWEWIDNYLGYDTFSTDIVLAYAVKLKSVMRWRKLSDQKGQKVLNDLINKIKSGINFSEEFLN